MTLLSTSTPNPVPDRFGPSTLVEAGNWTKLFQESTKHRRLDLEKPSHSLAEAEVFSRHPLL